MSEPIYNVLFLCTGNSARSILGACPVWPGRPLAAHWGMADPAAVRDSDAQKRQAFRAAFETLQVRIRAFAALPVGELGPAALKRRLDEIGRLPDHAAGPR